MVTQEYHARREKSPVSTRAMAQRFWPAVMQGTVLCALLGSFFGLDIYRFEVNSAAVAYLLHVIRGVFYVLGYYGIWVLFIGGIIWAMLSPRGWPETRIRLKQLWPVWLFTAYLVIEGLSSEAPEVALSRWKTFAWYVPPVLAAIAFLTTTRGVIRLRATFIVFGVIMLVIFAVGGHGALDYLRGTGGSATGGAGSDENFIVESDHITSGLNFLVCAIAGISLVMQTDTLWKMRLLTLGVVIPLIVFAILTGARGPAVSFVVALLVMMLLGCWKLWIKVVIVTLALVVGLGAYGILQSSAGQAADRMVSTSDNSSQERKSYYLFVLAQPPSLFGHGVGSFSILDPAAGENAYVHNSLLEAYLELGVTGLILFVGVIAGAYIRLFRRQRAWGDPATLFCITCFTFYFVESQFSGTITYMYTLHVFILLAYCLPAPPLAGAKKIGIGIRERGRSLL